MPGRKAHVLFCHPHIWALQLGSAHIWGQAFLDMYSFMPVTDSLHIGSVQPNLRIVLSSKGYG